MSPINGSGGSGSGSAENLSSGSNNQTSSASRGNTSNTTSTESFKPPTLTESLLNRHNEDMEKLMMQKHRELRSSIKASDKLKDSRIKTTEKMSTDPNMHFISQGHGVKRSGSHSWEGDSFKVSNSTINTHNLSSSWLMARKKRLNPFDYILLGFKAWRGVKNKYRGSIPHECHDDSYKHERRSIYRNSKRCQHQFVATFIGYRAPCLTCSTTQCATKVSVFSLKKKYILKKSNIKEG